MSPPAFNFEACNTPITCNLASFSLALPQLLTQDTAAVLSPRINTFPLGPWAVGLSPTDSSITYAVTAIPRRLSRFIVMLHVLRTSVFHFSSAVDAMG